MMAAEMNRTRDWIEALPPLKGALLVGPSLTYMTPPLSLMKKTTVLSVRFRLSSVFMIRATPSSRLWTMPAYVAWYFLPSGEGLALYLAT